MIKFSDFVQSTLGKQVPERDLKWHLVTLLTELLLEALNLQTVEEGLYCYSRIEYYYQGLCNIYDVRRVVGVPVESERTLGMEAELLQVLRPVLEAVRCDIIYQDQSKFELSGVMQNFDTILVQAYAYAGVTRESIQQEMMKCRITPTKFMRS